MEEKKSAINVKSVDKDVLQEFGVLKPGNIFLTDNGANVKAAFADYTWISCLGHNLN